MARDSQIENRNFLSPTGFKFTITRFPKVSFFCNEANIPDITLGIANQPTYLKDIDIPGDKITFGDLTIKFLVDEDFKNYNTIQNWIRGLGYPEKLSQFSDLNNSDAYDGVKYVQKGLNIYSDATLQILKSSQIANFQIKFRDIFPYSLSTLTFDATQTDIQYFTADVSFKYTIYNILNLSGNPL